MVCQRCIAAVNTAFEQLHITPIKVSLGEVHLAEEELDSTTLQQLDERLQRLGFERIDDKRSRLIGQLKTLVIQEIHHTNRVSVKVNWSSLLSDKLHYEYNYLSSLFSSVEGITIEQFIIRQKIERAKELLVYDELSLSEIADQLGYSSVAHLSAQFKKVTGFTPSVFKKEHQHTRKPIDGI